METALALQPQQFEKLKDFGLILRGKYPYRNEKYYQILLSAKDLLTEPRFKFHTTVDPIISEVHTSRPTWYSYFPSVESYYKEILKVDGEVMVECTLQNLSENVTFTNWISVTHELGVETFLGNARVLVGYYPELNSTWKSLYDQLINGYSEILGPILNLSPSRTVAFVRNTTNEKILNPDLYHRAPQLFYQFARREYSLLLADQND